MNPTDVAVTFACYNQVDYTRQCIDSLVRTGFDLSRLVVVDNGSTDGTRAYLSTLPLGGLQLNSRNLGCGVAWNQGALALQAEWTVVMNNDVVVTAGWLDALVGAAEAFGLKVVSPALVEGSLDYDLQQFSSEASRRMQGAVRRGGRHAVCMAVHASVWDEIGYFRATPRLWGFEDTVFFHELDRAGIPSGQVGASWLHHYGSITVSALKRERGFSQRQGLSARDAYKVLGEGFIGRKLGRWRRKRQERRWRDEELARYGMTLHGERVDGQFVWR